MTLKHNTHLALYYAISTVFYQKKFILKINPYLIWENVISIYTPMWFIIMLFTQLWCVLYLVYIYNVIKEMCIFWYTVLDLFW